MRKAYVIAVGLWLSSYAFAEPAPAAPESTFADLVAAQKNLRAEIASGKQTFAPDDQKALLKAQDQIFAVAKDNLTVADLNEDEWIKVHNAQEQINQIVTASAADQREVCRRERPTGSHRTTKVCLTVAQWRARQTSQTDIMRLTREGSGGLRRPSGGQ